MTCALKAGVYCFRVLLFVLFMGGGVYLILAHFAILIYGTIIPVMAPKILSGVGVAPPHSLALM